MVADSPRRLLCVRSVVLGENRRIVPIGVLHAIVSRLGKARLNDFLGSRKQADGAGEANRHEELLDHELSVLCRSEASQVLRNQFRWYMELDGTRCSVMVPEIALARGGFWDFFSYIRRACRR